MPLSHEDTRSDKASNASNQFFVHGKFLFACLIAILLLGIFILVNFIRFYQDSHQTIDSLAGTEREKLPASLEGKGKRLVFHDFESGNASDTSSHLATPGHGGRQALKLSSKVPFSPGLWVKVKDIHPTGSSWIRATGYVWFSCQPSEVKCNLVVTCNHQGTNYKYMFIPLEKEHLITGQWNSVAIDYVIPPAPSAEDILQVYFWYCGSHELLVDDINVGIYK